MIKDLDTTKSREVLDKFSKIIEVPQSRMYTKIELKDGKTEFGYAKATDGKDINFMCVEKSAAVVHMDQYIKYFSPDEDQDGDDNVFKYRNNNLYGHIYENKLAGIYVSHKTA